MANLQHSTLPSASVHEPKHISINGTTASGNVITNNSSVTGTSEYRRLVQADVDQLEVLWFMRDNDPDTINTLYLPATFAGDIISISGANEQAMATASNTYKMQIDGADVTGSTHTFDLVGGTGGNAGDIVTATPSAANSFSVGSQIAMVQTVAGNTDATAFIRWVITCQRT